MTDSILALIGLESEIAALREQARTGARTASGRRRGTPTERAKGLNFTFFWQPDRRTCRCCSPTAANSQTELELELSRQIRARLMAEAEISAKSKELARANADLESFAAIVSHDLKAPLRHMRHIADT